MAFAEQAWRTYTAQPKTNAEEREAQLNAVRQVILVDLLQKICAFYESTPRLFLAHALNYISLGVLSPEWRDVLQITGDRSEFQFDWASVDDSLSTIAESEAFNTEEPMPTLPRSSPYIGFQRHSPPCFNRRRGVGDHIKDMYAKMHEQGNEFDSVDMCEENKLTGNMRNLPILKNLSIFERDFRYVKTIGQGAFGVVYEAQSKVDLQNYAVKVIMVDAEKSEREKTLREVRNWSRLRHPNICRYSHAWLESTWALQGPTFANCGLSPELQSTPPYAPRQIEDARFSGDEDSVCSLDSDDNLVFEESECEAGNDTQTQSESDSHETLKPLRTRTTASVRRHKNRVAKKNTETAALFIQMELCRDTLSEWCANNESPARMNKEELSEHTMNVLTIFGQLMAGLEHCHTNGVVHRDIKPANIFRAADGCWVLGDFGVSKMVRERAGPPPWESEDSGCVGTLAYAAPEQISGEDVAPAADLYSIGFVLCEMMMACGTMHERAQAFRSLGKRELPDALVFRCFPKIGDLILCLTSPIPAERPTAASLVDMRSPWRQAITRELLQFCEEAHVQPHDVWPAQHTNSSE